MYVRLKPSVVKSFTSKQNLILRLEDVEES